MKPFDTEEMLGGRMNLRLARVLISSAMLIHCVPVLDGIMAILLKGLISVCAAQTYTDTSSSFWKFSKDV